MGYCYKIVWEFIKYFETHSETSKAKCRNKVKYFECLHAYTPRDYSQTKAKHSKHKSKRKETKMNAENYSDGESDDDTCVLEIMRFFCLYISQMTMQ